MLSEKAKSFLDELYTSKVMSSGSEDWEFHIVKNFRINHFDL